MLQPKLMDYLEMGKIVNLGILAIFAAIGVAYLTNTPFNIESLEIKDLITIQLETWEKWFYATSATWFIIAFINIFMRNRCPECREASPLLIESKEIDR
jgi:anaerobic C4-dicarboxylate transporter